MLEVGLVGFVVSFVLSIRVDEVLIVEVGKNFWRENRIVF